MRDRDVTKQRTSTSGFLRVESFRRPLGRGGLLLLAGLILAAPAVLFFDPLGLPGRGHIARDPLAIYSLYSDDFAYVASSRNLSLTVTNLFVPHNTHIVPAWRVLTWGLVAWSGTLVKLPDVLAEASYAILMAVMILMGRLVARETGSAGLGLAAMVGVGVTSVMTSPTCWYSAGQTLWAGFGILATLWYAQCWRRSRSPAALPLAAIWAMLAGWFWTIGHMAGPTAAVYLWLDGRRRCRWAAAVPIAATVAAVMLSLLLGGRQIDSTVSFHGRTTREAASPLSGITHTAQAIPENLILANLGLKAQTTALQGMVITAMVLGVWAAQRARRGGTRAFNPLECTGLALLLGAYLVEWTVRGYLPFRSLRTINLGMIVPWYDVVPQIGAVLFVAGWFAGPRGEAGEIRFRRSIAPPTRLAALGVLGLVVLMMALNKPRVDLLWRNWVPPLLPIERQREMFPILSLQTMRAGAILLDRADWQRRHLRRMDQAQEAARRLGIGRDAIHSALGRLDMPSLPKVYDAVGLLDLPETGTVTDPDQVRRALQPFLFKEKEPRPGWLPVGELWPPADQPHWSESDVDASE
jgi:hypothetical protein